MTPTSEIEGSSILKRPISSVAAVCLAISGGFFTAFIAAWDKPVLRDALLAGLINFFETFLLAVTCAGLVILYSLWVGVKHPERKTNRDRAIIVENALVLLVTVGMIFSGARFLWVLTEKPTLTALDCKIMRRDQLIDAASGGSKALAANFDATCATAKQRLW